ncbi:MAG: hypothetical protein EOP50_15425 [Sphingobacteriales bacterium]|nr:MAG: hypothetical protein EOP50_15425 [Sphingobacteriales bacterium]
MPPACHRRARHLLKDEFEIHKPLLLHGKALHKEDVVKMLAHIREKLAHKHAARHDSYLVCMSLLSSVDNLVSHIY